MTRALFFDLDGTLYESTPEIQGLIRARTAALVSEYTGLSNDEAHVRFEEAYQRTKSGSSALEEFGITDAKERLRDCIDEAGIEHVLKPDTRLQALLNKYSTSPCCIITDCRLKNTEAKLNALGVRDYFAKLFCWDTQLANKSNSRIFADVEDRLNLKPNECVMIGDSEKDDILTPSARGWTTVRIADRSKTIATYAIPSIYTLEFVL